jgi:hypothetical protein
MGKFPFEIFLGYQDFNSGSLSRKINILLKRKFPETYQRFKESGKKLKIEPESTFKNFVLVLGLFRPDGRCGAEFPLDDGTPAECDPNSEYW